MLDGKSVTIPPVSEKGQDARMTRRRVLILAAIVAALLLAADFHDLFVLPSLRRLWPCLGDVCGWLAKPLPMALVTLGASLALPRDSARLPVVVNLAAALLLGMALERLPGARGFALLRLTPETAQAMSTVCFYGFLLWVACRCCAPGALRVALTALLAAVVLLAVARALPDGPRFLSEVPAMAAITAAYLWLLTGLARRHAAKAEA